MILFPRLPLRARSLNIGRVRRKTTHVNAKSHTWHGICILYTNEMTEA
jgi:hypothetical protein